MKRVLSVILSLVFAITLMAQDVATSATKQVTGVVVDATNFPIIGATVLVKNTDNGTITDFDGNFTLDNVKADGTENITIEKAVEMAKALIEEGRRPTDACKEIASITGYKKSEIYNLL